EFALPCVLTRGKTTRVKLFGRNLVPASSRKAPASLALDCVEVEIKPPDTSRQEAIPLPLRPAQVSVDAFAYHHPRGHVPVMISVTDVPVVSVSAANTASDQAQEIAVPCEVSGQLTESDERHWYAVRVRKGEVLWLEAFGTRIGSPVDL